MKKKKKLEWWNRWINENWVVKRRKSAETLQKAVRQNCLIIDAYNSRQKLKIDDKCTEADDVIHCIHHSDYYAGCWLSLHHVTVSVPTQSFFCWILCLNDVIGHFSLWISRPWQSFACIHHSTTRSRAHAQLEYWCMQFKAETGKQFYSCHVSELTASRFSRSSGLLAHTHLKCYSHTSTFACFSSNIKLWTFCILFKNYWLIWMRGVKTKSSVYKFTYCKW